LERTLTVSNKLGLHARPAALLVQTANKFRSQIKIAKGDVQVDGKSIMGILMLAAESGAALAVKITGDDEAEAMKALEDIFQRKFDEE
jgi:phosphocarrier protein HPr